MNGNSHKKYIPRAADSEIVEANRRLEELRSGSVIGIPGVEALAKLRAKYAE
jgi:hypothetical protein